MLFMKSQGRDAPPATSSPQQMRGAEAAFGGLFTGSILNMALLPIRMIFQMKF